MLHCRQKLNSGFSLIELMVVVAIIAVISAIAIPAYNGYVHTARMTEGQDNIATIHLAQVEFFEENGFFLSGGNTATLIANANGMWLPSPWDRSETNAQNILALNFTYAIANCVLGGGGNGALDANNNPTECYTITATGKGMLSATDVLTASN